MDIDLILVLQGLILNKKTRQLAQQISASFKMMILLLWKMGPR